MQLEKNVEALLSALESGLLPQDFPNIMISLSLLLSLLLARSLDLSLSLLLHSRALVLSCSFYAHSHTPRSSHSFEDDGCAGITTLQDLSADDNHSSVSTAVMDSNASVWRWRAAYKIVMRRVDRAEGLSCI